MATFIVTDTGHDNHQVGILCGDDDDFRLVYFALRDYADQLTRSIDANDSEHPATNENLQFLHKTLGDVYAMLFEITENHAEGELNVVKHFLNV